MFGKAGNQRDNGPDRVRRLERTPERQFAGHFVHAGHTAAGFQRARMGAVIVHHFLGHDIGASQNSLGRVLVTLFPRKDVVVVFARAMCALGLTGKVFAQDDIGFQRLKRVNDDGQLFVLDIDQFSGVRRGIAVFGDDVGDLLALEKDLTVGQNHLFVARKGWHPVQAQWL